MRPTSLSPAAGIRRIFWQLLYRRSQPMTPHELSLSALVFSPHYDDETLGCGGLIIKKRLAGAPVKIVFMTDGSRSHAQWMDPQQLRTLRTQEAVNAAKTLGLEEGEVLRLGFPETELLQSFGPAVEQVRAVLRKEMPSQVFLPYAGEPDLWSLDHQATTMIIMEALHCEKMSVDIYEYPIWFWYHWPWVGIRIERGQFASKIIKNSLNAHFGLCLLKNFRSSIYVGDILSQKKAALAEHQSQMKRLSGSEWPILSDIAKGEFLTCFFGEHEVFHHFRYPSLGHPSLGHPSLGHPDRGRA